MLGRGVLSRLHCLTQHESATLTIYVDIDQNRMSNRNSGYLVQAEALLKELRSGQREDEDLKAACRQAIEILKELAPTGKSAVVVIHPASDVQEVHQAKVSFPPCAYWRQGAFLRPVVEAMDEYECYGVVLTDSNKARIFTVHLGEITEHEGLVSEVDGRSRAQGSDQMRSQKRHDRRHEEAITNHAKRTIDALHDLAVASPFDRLIVAGPTKAASQLVRLLPRRMRGKLVETISMPVTASKEAVLDGILEVQEAMERAQESAIIDALITELYDGGKAVVGVDEVLEAANDGRIWKLVYGRGLALEGSVCTHCGSLSQNEGADCIRCGGASKPIPRLVDRLCQKVLEIGGQVEIVDGDARIRLQEKGPVAALLRY